MYGAFVFVFALSCLLPAGVLAGVGRGDSAPGKLDAKAPVLVLPALAPNTVVRAGQSYPFAWNVVELHPGPAGQARARIVINGVARDSLASPPAGPGHWDWLAPNLSSGRCVFALAVTDSFGNRAALATGPFTVLSLATGVPPSLADGPAALRVPWPNPFNPSTRVAYALAAPGEVRLTCFDARGRAVRRLVAGPQAAGEHVVTWSGTDDAGRRLAAGTYLLRLAWRGDAGSVERTAKVVMVP